MIVKKEDLARLRGILPCSDTVEFTPYLFTAILENEETKHLAPKVEIRQLTNAELEKCRKFCEKETTGEYADGKRSAAHSAIGENIIGWSNMFNASTGELFQYSREAVEKLPETLLIAILKEAMLYAGVIAR